MHIVITYDLNTPIGKVRRLISDTDETNAVYTDEEIQFFLDENDGNIYASSATALEVMASDKIRMAKKLSIEGLSIDMSAATSQILDLADRYRERANDLLGEVDSISLLETETLVRVLGGDDYGIQW